MGETLTHRSIRELAREVHSAKRNAVSRIMMQNVERERSYFSASKHEEKETPIQFFGNLVDSESGVPMGVQKKDIYSVNMDGVELYRSTTAAAGTPSASTVASGGVSSEDSDTIRSLDARLRELQA